MTEATKSSKSPNLTRKWLISAALAGGVAVGAASIAGAVSGSSATTPTSAATANRGDHTMAGHDMAGHDKDGQGDHGHRDEKVITGANADKAKAAALAAKPGTVLKVEQCSAGTYEVEIKQADGTEVHVDVDASFKVTGSHSRGDGMGHGDHRGHGDHDGEGNDDDTTQTTAGVAN